MTLLELKTAIKANIGNRTDKDDVVATGVKLALQDICKRHDFRAMSVIYEPTIATSDASFPLPAGFKSLKMVYWINGTQSYRLRIRLRDWILRRYPDPESLNTALPVYGYIEGLNVFVYPRPNQDGVIRAFCTTYLTLDSDAQETTIPSIDAAIISYGTYHVMKSIGLRQEAQSFLTDYLADYQTAKEADIKQPAEELIMDGHRSAADDEFALGDVHDPFYQIPFPYGG